MATIDILPARQTQASPDITRIRPSRGWRAIDLREVRQYRELLWFLTLRDIKLRYKQTALGVSWAVLQPLFTMAVFTIFFGKLGKMPSDGKPYALFVLAALLPWQLFAYALTQSSNSLVAEQRLITKVYFPRLIVPVASVLSGLVDLLVALCLMVAMIAAGPVFGWFIVKPTAAIRGGMRTWRSSVPAPTCRGGRLGPPPAASPAGFDSSATGPTFRISWRAVTLSPTQLKTF